MNKLDLSYEIRILYEEIARSASKRHLNDLNCSSVLLEEVLRGNGDKISLATLLSMKEELETLKSNVKAFKIIVESW